MTLRLIGIDPFGLAGVRSAVTEVATLDGAACPFNQRPELAASGAISAMSRRA